ncbi:MAG: hypothetical protein IKP75_06150 [Oscillospiraceae bacterium]|nr:hypothetical protein [Oscillospiraceae bacterium]
MGCLQWTANQYTITFDTDGGSDVAAITQDYGTAGTTTKTAARIAAKSTDTGYVVRASVNGKLTKVTKSDIATAE